MLQLIPERYRNAPGAPDPNANGLGVDSSSDSGDQQSVHSQENPQYPEGFLDLLSTNWTVSCECRFRNSKEVRKGRRLQ